MRTASQILARHCPVPHPVRESGEEDGDFEYYVPMKDALAAVREAANEASPAPQYDISPARAMGLIALALITSPFTFVFAGAGAVIDHVEAAIARVRLRQTE